MEIRGTVQHILPVMTGQSSRGEWKKQSVVIEIPGQYPKSVCMDIWGDNIDNFQLNQGEELIAQIDIESREYNGKWFTNVKAWKIEKAQSTSAPSAPNQDAVSSENDPYANMSSEDEDDLPF